LGRLAAAFNEMLARIEGAKASDQESQDRLRRFVADASHELRTPLAAIGGYAELYRRGGLEDRAELDRAMARVESESARMHRLVEDLLLLARMDEGPQLTRERVNLIDTISGVVADHRAIDATRPVSIVAPQPATVEGDGARLAQVFANLLANVRTHTPEGTTVLIDIGVVGGEVSVEIVDDGPGIPADDADRVFDRFYRVDPSRSRQRGGSGLGLSIVSAIVAAHGGTVEAGSSGSGGARFMVRLPLAAGLGASGPVERVDGPG
jgi:two-component system OmpR family sensor kinase